MLSKRNPLVYAAQIAILDVKVVLELHYLLSHENVFVNGDTTTRVFKPISGLKWVVSFMLWSLYSRVDMAAKADACTRGKSNFCRQASGKVL